MYKENKGKLCDPNPRKLQIPEVSMIKSELTFAEEVVRRG